MTAGLQHGGASADNGGAGRGSALAQSSGRWSWWRLGGRPARGGGALRRVVERESQPEREIEEVAGGRTWGELVDA
uniref:Uncharacterized protein n=1 Tax=Arundo donax TaxID=35708 RepID=A0A0A9B6G4_ARUDO